MSTAQTDCTSDSGTPHNPAHLYGPLPSAPAKAAQVVMALVAAGHLSASVFPFVVPVPGYSSSSAALSPPLVM